MNDGYLTDYHDLMNKVGLVQADFFLHFDIFIDAMNIDKKDSSNTIYTEVRDDLRMFIDEQTKELLFKAVTML